MKNTLTATTRRIMMTMFEKVGGDKPKENRTSASIEDKFDIILEGVMGNIMPKIHEKDLTGCVWDHADTRKQALKGISTQQDKIISVKKDDHALAILTLQGSDGCYDRTIGGMDWDHRYTIFAREKNEFNISFTESDTVFQAMMNNTVYYMAADPNVGAK